MKATRSGTAVLAVASALLAACGGVSAQSGSKPDGWWVEGCSALDWAGTYDPIATKFMYYDAIQGKVIATQDINVATRLVYSAHVDLPGGYLVTRETAYDPNNITSGTQTEISMCLQPPGVYPMKCVDNEDIGTAEKTPTEVDDNCTVLAYNIFYTEPKESDCESSFCQGPCALCHAGAAPPRAFEHAHLSAPIPPLSRVLRACMRSRDCVPTNSLLTLTREYTRSRACSGALYDTRHTSRLRTYTAAVAFHIMERVDDAP